MTRNKILVVEDEIIIARELESRLKDLGYQVPAIASSGQEALTIAEQVKPDLVMMDIVLKGEMDGVEAAAEMRRRWGTPIIYLTAYTDDATLQRARVTEPFGYIVKPFSDRELRANLEMALYKHQAEAKLKAVENWFATSMQQTEDGVIATDPQHNITYINRVGEVLTGWSQAEAVGRQAEAVIPFLGGTEDSWPPSSFGEAGQSGLIIEAGGGMTLLNRRSGEEIPVYLAITPLRNSDGYANGAVILIRDLSEQKRTARLLQEHEARFRQLQKLEAVSQMAGGLAHQYNNLLFAILGHTHLLLGSAGVDAESRELLKNIELAANIASRLTAQLLTISCKQVVRPKVVNLNTLISNLEQELGSWGSSKIAVNKLLAPDLALVRVDPDQMGQVIRNITLNAREAMPQGGRLTIETANVALDPNLVDDFLEGLPEPATASTRGAMVLLAVGDTGHGMSEEVLSHIFEPFFTTKAFGPDAGMGLATVYGIVKQSGGHITVESKVDQGTTLRVFLPAVVEGSILAEPVIPAETPLEQPGGETVLVVEDEAMLRGVVRKVLEIEGYRVLLAGRPEEALQLSSEYPEAIHLLLTDMVMPGMNGRQLVKRINELRPATRVLYFSGYPDEVAFGDDLAEITTCYLRKPCSLEELLHKVREALA